MGDGVVGAVVPGSGEIWAARFLIGEAIKAIRIRIDGGVNEVISKIEVFDDLFKQVFSGGLLDSSGGIGVGVSEGEVEISTYPNVAIMMISGLHL